MKKLTFALTLVLLNAMLASAGEPMKPGTIAPDFSLKNIKGETVSLSSIENAKGYIVVFYSNTCPVAQRYEQRIIDLDREFAQKGFPVIAVNSNDKDAVPGDSYNEMKKLADKKGYKFQFLYDETQEVARNYGATNTPHVYVLSKNNGQLKVEYVGAIDNNPDDPSGADKKYVTDAVSSLLKGEPVRTGSTKAVGCSIKWKKV